MAIYLIELYDKFTPFNCRAAAAYDLMSLQQPRGLREVFGAHCSDPLLPPTNQSRTSTKEQVKDGAFSFS
jgi:hypothetical protein